MSVILPLQVQGNGALRGWESITGAASAWQAVDDSSGTTHDSDTTYIVLPRLTGTEAGRVSFPLFLQCQPGQMLSVSVTVAAAIESGNPQLEIGFYRSGVLSLHASTFTPGVQYGTATRTFTTDPFHAAAWTPDDVIGLEACVRMVFGVVGKARITLVSGSLTAAMPTNPQRVNDGRWRTS